MKCAILGCGMEYSQEKNPNHYLNHHQKFQCEKCKDYFMGNQQLSKHMVAGCQRPQSKKEIQAKKVVKKRASSSPQLGTKSILAWLVKMSEARLDPTSTFSSLEVWTTPEKCKTKVRFRNTDEAILFLARLEKKSGEHILQLPYRCDHCKGIHNTHLISRRALNDLISKYEKRTKKKKPSEEST
jgi:hypothetical protein